MQLNCQSFLCQLTENEFDPLFDFFCKQNGWCYFSGPFTYRTHLSRINIHFGPHPLSGDLHQTEFAQRKYVVLRSVGTLRLLHLIENFLTVFITVHIDKIDHEQTTESTYA